MPNTVRESTLQNFNESAWKKFFVIASLWNISAAPLIFVIYKYFPNLIFTDQGIKFVHNPVVDAFYYITLMAIFLFGIGYCTPAFDLMSNRIMIWLGIMGKVVLTIILCHLYFTKFLTPLLPILLVGDLVWAFFFFKFLVNTKHMVKVNNFVG